MAINENYREEYKGYIITTEYTKKSKLIGDRYYTAIARKAGMADIEHQDSSSFKGAIEQVKTYIDFKLPSND